MNGESTGIGSGTRDDAVAREAGVVEVEYSDGTRIALHADAAGRLDLRLAGETLQVTWPRPRRRPGPRLWAPAVCLGLLLAGVAAWWLVREAPNWVRIPPLARLRHVVEDYYREGFLTVANRQPFDDEDIWDRTAKRNGFEGAAALRDWWSRAVPPEVASRIHTEEARRHNMRIQRFLEDRFRADVEQNEAGLGD